MTIQATTPDYRGIYHFSPAKHWMNDPNGMVFFDGEYHLFFQHHPFGTTWGPMHWGHAVTCNLIDWEELPIAIEPDEHGTIFSGSAVVDTHNTTGFFPDGPGLVAIFTHHLECPGTPTVQTQSLAYSRDKGRTWSKYEGNPVLKREGWPDFRDPKVFWHEQTRQWIMVLACGQMQLQALTADQRAGIFTVHCDINGRAVIGTAGHVGNVNLSWPRGEIFGRNHGRAFKEIFSRCRYRCCGRFIFLVAGAAGQGYGGHRYGQGETTDHYTSLSSAAFNQLF